MAQIIIGEGPHQSHRAKLTMSNMAFGGSLHGKRRRVLEVPLLGRTALNRASATFAGISWWLKAPTWLRSHMDMHAHGFF